MTNSDSIQELIQAVEQANSDDRLVESVRALVGCHSEDEIPSVIDVFG